MICNGCHHANKMREADASLDPSCPVCRESMMKVTADELEKHMMKRIEANDPVAMTHEGVEQTQKGDYSSAFEYFTRAAELGDVEAHFELAALYRDGHGVEKDKQKKIHHLELAAIGGHPYARYALGCEEWDNNDWDNNDNAERAMKHWIIAASLGDDRPIQFMIEMSRRDMSAKTTLILLFVHIRPLWIKPRVRRGKQPKNINELLNYVMSCYSSNRRAPILGLPDLLFTSAA